MSNKAATQVIAVGFEALEPILLERWCAEGLLPNFSKFMAEGAYRRMLSSAEISSGSTWSTINCGVTPGKHGMGFCHREFKSGTYQVRKKRADEVGRLPFWKQLSESGRKIFTLDVPETRTYGLNGVELVGWGLEYEAWHAESTPAGLIDEIKRKYGKHPLEGWYQTRPKSVEEWKWIVDSVLSATKTRTRIVMDMLQSQHFDFALPVYAETHFAGHLFWHFTDPNHFDYDPKLVEELGNPILECYKLCDQALGEFRAAFPKATFLAFSNTGMGPNYSARHFVGEIIEKLQLRAKTGTSGTRGAKSLVRYFVPAGDVFGVERFEKIFGTANINRMKKVIPVKIWDTWTRRFLAAGNDWKDSLAFDIPGDNTGTLRVNLKGREPNGLVEPGDEYEKLLARIADELMKLVDLDTNEPAVQEVVRVREKYRGDENVEDLPDLLIRWKPGALMKRMHSPTIGTIERDHLPDKRTGAHTDYGFFAAIGPGIMKSDKPLAPAENWDVAATVLSMFGEPLSDDLDGEPMFDIIGDVWTARREMAS